MPRREDDEPMARDRVITMSELKVLERDAALYANREERDKRRQGRQRRNDDRWAELLAWARARGIGMERACLTILHHGWDVLELDFGGGRRAHVRQVGAGFYVAVLGTGARGRLKPEELRDVLERLTKEAKET